MKSCIIVQYIALTETKFDASANYRYTYQKTVFFYFKETRNLFILQVICKMSNVALLNNMLHSEED